jgi:predicted DCC family thiol-disulfide oxidoreductase YuxK
LEQNIHGEIIFAATVPLRLLFLLVSTTDRRQNVSMVETSLPPAASAVAVYFDGGCPICSREIGFYQRQAGADSINWVDVNRCSENALPDGVSRTAAMARFHVRTADGITDGAAAFIALWKALPRFRLIGRLLSVPPMPWLLERGYRIFLRIRPTRKLAACDTCVK